MVVQVMFRPSNERERMLGRILALLFCTSIRIALCISVYVEIINCDDVGARARTSEARHSIYCSYNCKQVHSTAGCCTCKGTHYY